MSQLKEMLVHGNSLGSMSPPQKTITLRLAEAFEISTELLFLDHEELAKVTDTGTKEQWQEFLRLPEVMSYVKAQMAFLAQISQRKTFSSLVSMALQGNQQAAKQVQELSGIMNQQDTNRTIILHYIPRPKPSDQNNQTNQTNESLEVK